MKNQLFFVLVIGFGAILGSVLNHLLALAGAPVWMTNTIPMGFDPPFTLDLLVIQCTFGLTLSMSFGTVLGMLIAVIAFHKRF